MASASKVLHVNLCILWSIYVYSMCAHGCIQTVVTSNGGRGPHCCVGKGVVNNFHLAYLIIPGCQYQKLTL